MHRIPHARDDSDVPALHEAFLQGINWIGACTACADRNGDRVADVSTLCPDHHRYPTSLGRRRGNREHDLIRSRESRASPAVYRGNRNAAHEDFHFGGQIASRRRCGVARNRAQACGPQNHRLAHGERLIQRIHAVTGIRQDARPIAGAERGEDPHAAGDHLDRRWVTLEAVEGHLQGLKTHRRAGRHNRVNLSCADKDRNHCDRLRANKSGDRDAAQ